MRTNRRNQRQAAVRDENDEFMRAELEAFTAELAESWRDVLLPHKVRQALNCIHKYLFDECLNVAFVCKECGLHNHNISCDFKRWIGVGMRSYIERQRLQAAEWLLRYERLTISDISWAVGYLYLESFERAFRRYKDRPPQQFRKMSLRRSDKTKG